MSDTAIVRGLRLPSNTNRPTVFGALRHLWWAASARTCVAASDHSLRPQRHGGVAKRSSKRQQCRVKWTDCDIAAMPGCNARIFRPHQRGTRVITAVDFDVVTIVATLACAPLAHAMHNDYLSEFHRGVAILNSQQLLIAVRRICAVTLHGQFSANATRSVSKDLNLGPSSLRTARAMVVNLE